MHRIHMVLVELSGVPVQAGAAPAGTPTVVVDGAVVQAATPLAIPPAACPAVALEDLQLLGVFLLLTGLGLLGLIIVLKIKLERDTVRFLRATTSNETPSNKRGNDLR